MENHFAGVTPRERYDNEVLNTLREIRELLSRDSKTVEQTPEKQETIKRQYTKRGVR
jgi:hypothetical protein